MRAEAELKAALVEEGWPAQVLERDKARKEAGYGLNETACGIAAAERPQFDLDHLFKYHTPNFEQNKQYSDIRRAAKFFAETIIGNTPPGADQQAAIRKLRDCVMTANAAIALGGRT